MGAVDPAELENVPNIGVDGIRVEPWSTNSGYVDSADFDGNNIGKGRGRKNSKEVHKHP